MNHPRLLVYLGLGLAVLVGAIIFAESDKYANRLAPSSLSTVYIDTIDNSSEAPTPRITFDTDSLTSSTGNLTISGTMNGITSGYVLVGSGEALRDYPAEAHNGRWSVKIDSLAMGPLAPGTYPVVFVGGNNQVLARTTLIVQGEPLDVSIEEVTMREMQQSVATYGGQTNVDYGIIQTIDGVNHSSERILEEYGTRTFYAFEKHPELIGYVKMLDPNFDPESMGVSIASSIYKKDERSSILIISGCLPHNCGGHIKVVAFEPSTKAVYLLQQKDKDMLQLYGHPDIGTRTAMFMVMMGWGGVGHDKNVEKG
ncbi:MAG TPA: hypothetical protein VJG64_00720 [Candidatus Paceibacterota bacterium]